MVDGEGVPFPAAGVEKRAAVRVTFRNKVLLSLRERSHALQHACTFTPTRRRGVAGVAGQGGAGEEGGWWSREAESTKQKDAGEEVMTAEREGRALGEHNTSRDQLLGAPLGRTPGEDRGGVR